MEYFKRLACNNDRKDAVLNEELAKELADTHNTAGIEEIASYLHDKNKVIQSNCLKVLYEIGYTKPELIARYVSDFITFLSGKNNRMIWGSMIALATITELKPNEIWNSINVIIETMKKGTLITEVWGIKVLVKLSPLHDDYYNKLTPILLDYIKTCRPIDFATRLDLILPVLKPGELNTALEIIEGKKSELKPGQLKKVNAIIKKY